MVRRACLVMNPVSGNDTSSVDKLPQLIAAMQTGGIEADVMLTEADRSPQAIAQQAVAADYDLVIVGGGDGTVSEVAKGLLHSSVPLGILPIGTYNNIARSLNLPVDLDAACDVIVQGKLAAIDVGLANETHHFFEAAGVGLDAVLFPLGEAVKGGRWGRLLQAARLTLNYQPKRVQIQFDRSLLAARHPAKLDLPPKRRFSWRRLAASRTQVQRSALLIVIANGPYYGTGFTVAPDAQLDDGLLTISVFRNFSKWELLRHFWSISLGQYHYSPKIETYRAAEVHLSARVPLPVHIDGHPIGELPVTLKVLKQALRVIVPAHPPLSQPPADADPPIALPVEGD
jgi:diacylglycerol kinase (ATP)